MSGTVNNLGETMLKKVIGFVSATGLVVASHATLAAVMASNTPAAPAIKHATPVVKHAVAAPVAATPAPQPGFDRQQAHHAMTNAPTAQPTGAGYYFTSEDYHPYVGMSANYTRFSLPDYGMASVSSASIQAKPLAKTSPATNVIYPTLYAGYHFQNHFIPALFGQHANIEMRFSWFNRGYSDRKANVGQGMVWRINGAGKANSQLGASADLTDYRYSNNVGYKNFALLFKGDRGSSNPYFSINPFFGMVYTQLNQDFKSSIKYADVGNPNTTTDSIDGSNDTYYIGPAFGTNLTYHFTAHFDALVNLNLQLLYASTGLKESQVPISGINTTIKVTDNNRKFTYRGLFSVETRYNFKADPVSPSIGLVLGLDKWGYVGEVRNPRGSAESKKARIIDATENNPYAMLDFNIPLML
jgi:hypothetical protein